MALNYSFLKRPILLALFCCMMNLVIAQTPEIKKIRSTGKHNSASLGFNIPVGNFSLTHFGGIALEYSRSNQHFGKWQSVLAKKLGLVVNGGVAYYSGKKELVSGYRYHYPGYSFLHVYPGLLYHLNPKSTMSLSAGPAIRLYNGTVQFCMGANLMGSYYLNKVLAITPGLICIKESGADPLMSLSLKASLAF
ncbi:MAG: hypothetical protein IPQ06_08650 [Chitinophagaceae bacterium]|nr:hypothetical protein [Chitinophagaceae bacterium]